MDSGQAELTPAQQQELIKLMGTVYGDSRKLDENIVSPTNTLTRDKSQNVKRAVEEMLQKTARPVAPPVQPIAPIIQKVEDTAPQLPQQVPAVVEQSPSNQLEFNFNTSEKDLLFKALKSMEAKLESQSKQIGLIIQILRENSTPVGAKKKD